MLVSCSSSGGPLWMGFISDLIESDPCGKGLARTITLSLIATAVMTLAKAVAMRRKRKRKGLIVAVPMVSYWPPEPGSDRNYGGQSRIGLYQARSGRVRSPRVRVPVHCRRQIEYAHRPGWYVQGCALQDRLDLALV